MKNKVLAIVFDELYLTAACNMLKSLARTVRPRDDFTIGAFMPESTSPTARQCLLSHAAGSGLPVEVRFIHHNFSMLPVVEPYTHSIYLRLLLPDLLPEAQQIVYLDVDLVVRRNLAELFGIELGDAPLAAVRDAFLPTLRSAVPNCGQERSHELGDLPYFNSGVMVINADVWRTKLIGARAIEMIRRWKPTLTWLDQDALNIVTAGQWIELDRRWNVFSITDQPRGSIPYHVAADKSMAEQVRLERESYVLHFVGPRKPWDEAYPRTSNWELYRRITQ
jgi:lipopolysaccharide biosynthesis glycosyltransferase